MTIALSVVLGALFLVTGGVKVLGLPQSLAIRDHFRLTPARWRLIGLLEVAGGVGTVAGLAWRPLSIAALAGLLLLMLGAIGYRRRVRDPLVLLGVDLVVLALVIVTLLGRLLR